MLLSTLLLYFSVIIIVILLSWINIKFTLNFLGYNRTIISTYNIAAIILILFSGFRYSVGTDYFAYFGIINWVNSGDFFYWKSYLIHFLSEVIIYFDIPYYWLFIFTSTLTVFFVFKTISHLFKGKEYIGITFFLVGGLYLYSFNGVKVSLAISILLYSIQYIESKKFLKYTALILFAASWHIFSLVFIPLYFIINKNIKGLFILLTLLLFIPSKLIINILSYLVTIPVLSRYSGYIGSKYLVINNFSFTLGLLVVFSIALLVTLFFSEMNDYDKKKYRAYFNLYILGVFFYALTSRLLIFIRVVDYFYYFYIILFPIVIIKSSRKTNQIVLYLGLSAIFSYFLIGMISDPNRKLYPYKTIFSNYNHTASKKILFIDEYGRKTDYVMDDK